MRFSCVCLCLYTGRETRLPLTIKGEGIGPKLQLNYNLMNMKNVFMGDKDCYEVRKVKPKETVVSYQKMISKDMLVISWGVQFMMKTVNLNVVNSLCVASSPYLV